MSNPVHLEINDNHLQIREGGDFKYLFRGKSLKVLEQFVEIVGPDVISKAMKQF